ncbi:DUF551 domain-containing protein [Cronobacter sakazakii]|uniref:DUF551 domain-containing protein n=1 Tax=Cronobacter sakazakii TaxID=28141 RepID=UPI000CFDCCF0|nr:DUF551 domain-containing protein [Cronobacter sakazakii]
MSEISKVIASEIADFFAGFGGPGEPDIQSGEAQRLLTERLLSVLALRERADPVAVVNSNMRRICKKCSASIVGYSVDGLCEDCYLAAPPAPVVPEWIACSERMPELDTRVLLYFPDYGGHIEDGCIGDEGDGPYHYFFDGDSLRHEPTHWMPLPEAPATN